MSLCNFSFKPSFLIHDNYCFKRRDYSLARNYACYVCTEKRMRCKCTLSIKNNITSINNAHNHEETALAKRKVLASLIKIQTRGFCELDANLQDIVEEETSELKRQGLSFAKVRIWTVKKIIRQIEGSRRVKTPLKREACSQLQDIVEDYEPKLMQCVDILRAQFSLVDVRLINNITQQRQHFSLDRPFLFIISEQEKWFTLKSDNRRVYYLRKSRRFRGFEFYTGCFG